MRKLEYKKKLKEVYLQVGDDHIRHGMHWYREANRECIRKARELRIEPYLFIAVVAALSPQKKWESNIDDAVKYITSHGKAKIFATDAMKQKCKEILAINGYIYGRCGKHMIYNPEKVRKILKGRKVVSFFNNILVPHISMTVTVDRWAMRSVGMQGTLTNKKYGEIEDVHKEVAKEIGILPHELQAICWCKVRGL